MTIGSKIVLPVSLALLLVGCGDDVTNNNTTGAKSVADLSQAGACGAETVGELVLNGEDDALYVCNGKNWVSLNGEAVEPAGGCSLNSIEVDGVEGVEIDCGNAKDTVLNGAPGAAGAPGAPGAAGQSCVGNKIAQGLQIVCGGVILDTLTNGEDGADGAPGAAGQSCVGNKIAQGLQIVCGGVVLDTLTNGQDGAPGAAGQSCNATKFNTGLDSGVVIRCGGAVVDTLRDGEKGETGATGRPGSAGSSCTGTKISGGVVIRCGGVVIDTLPDSENHIALCITNNVTNGYASIAYDTRDRFCDTRDGHVYAYKKIGNQTWMTQNLDFGNGRCLGDQPDSCLRYGRLYLWSVAMDSSNTGCGYGKTCTASGTSVRGNCPVGWHLPTADEWSELAIYVGGAYGETAATKLKSTVLWNHRGGSNGTDDYDFDMRPAGSRNADDTFDYSAKAGFWMAAESNATQGRLAMCNNTRFYSAVAAKNNGYSIRCVKNP